MRIIPGLLLLVLTSAAVTAERAQSLDEILERHAAASGTPPQSAQFELLIEEPAFTVTGRYSADRDGRMRIDIYDGETRVFTEALDGNDGWQWFHGEEESVPLSETGRAALARGVVNNLYALHERPALGYTLSYEGVVSDDEDCFWKIASTSPDGFREVYYLDTETALIARKSQFAALHPDIDPTEVERLTYLGDYREVDGRMISFESRTVNAATGEEMQRTRITSVINNSRIRDTHYASALPVAN